LIVVSK